MALQGEKEAIANVAYKVAQRDWDKKLGKPHFCENVITALSMAVVLESSDRAKAYVVAAMKH